jgi:hypothetical protein
VGQQAPVTVEHGGSAFITGGFEGEDSHGTASLEAESL